jgi:hypothetical protein
LEGTELDFENFNVGDDDYDPNASEKSKSGMSHHSLKSSRRNSVEKTYSYEPAKEHRSDDSDSEINVNDPNDPEDEEKSSRSVKHNAEKVSEDTKVEFSAEFTQGPDVDKIDELS